MSDLIPQRGGDQPHEGVTSGDPLLIDPSYTISPNSYGGELSPAHPRFSLLDGAIDIILATTAGGAPFFNASDNVIAATDPSLAADEDHVGGIGALNSDASGDSFYWEMRRKLAFLDIEVQRLAVSDESLVEELEKVIRYLKKYEGATTADGLRELYCKISIDMDPMKCNKPKVEKQLIRRGEH